MAAYTKYFKPTTSKILKANLSFPYATLLSNVSEVTKSTNSFGKTHFGPENLLSCLLSRYDSTIKTTVVNKSVRKRYGTTFASRTVDDDCL